MEALYALHAKLGSALLKEGCSLAVLFMYCLKHTEEISFVTIWTFEDVGDEVGERIYSRLHDMKSSYREE